MRRCVIVVYVSVQTWCTHTSLCASEVLVGCVSHRAQVWISTRVCATTGACGSSQSFLSTTGGIERSRLLHDLARNKDSYYRISSWGWTTEGVGCQATITLHAWWFIANTCSAKQNIQCAMFESLLAKLPIFHVESTFVSLWLICRCTVRLTIYAHRIDVLWIQ